jgi:hypothetical protein
MSFLYPLLLAGIAAIGVPIVLHMIRRHTRKRVTFSSLMFVRTTAPRLRNRSRVENLPLLILRCLLLILLAVAFARPLFSRQEPEAVVRAGRRIVLLVDTSASMRRSGLWDQAIDEVRSVLRSVEPMDRLCLMTFDRSARIQIGFEQWAGLDVPQRTAAVIDCLWDLSPGWAATDLGRALVAAAEAVEDDEVHDDRQRVGPRQIVLIGDVQQGSRLDALHTYEWPAATELTVRPVDSRGLTNATLEWVVHHDRLASPDGNEAFRIRVSNSSEATTEQFQLRWGAQATAMQIYVPPGTSHVVQIPPPPDPSVTGRLILTGDDHDFDNTLYIAPRLQQQIDILYIGRDDPNDPQGMLFYLRQAFGTADARVTGRLGEEALSVDEIAAAHLIVIADVVGPESVAALRQHIVAGRTTLLAMKSPNAAAALGGLTGVRNIEAEEADPGRYAMLGRMEFAHPVLSAFSDPRFGDFTRIHFWRHRRVDLAGLPDAHVLAWYDSNDPAWFEVPVGSGTLLVLTGGWHPADSDLALSSKFVPLLYSILEYGGVRMETQAQYVVGDPVPVTGPGGPRADVRVRKPDGATVALDAGVDTFTETDVPGIYGVESADETTWFAVNVAASEGRTDPMPLEDIERLGLSMKTPGPAATGQVAKTTIHTGLVETEGRQKLWRWVLVAALVVLLMEIWLAGRLTRTATESQGEQL